ncbi:hypothetical protein D3C75_1223320 [compost metagenome]
MPAEKCLPAPLITTARTASVSSIHLKISTISLQNGAFIALYFSGRLICTWAMLSLSSTLNAWYSVTVLSLKAARIIAGLYQGTRIAEGRACAKTGTFTLI